MNSGGKKKKKKTGASSGSVTSGALSAAVSGDASRVVMGEASPRAPIMASCAAPAAAPATYSIVVTVDGVLEAEKAALSVTVLKNDADAIAGLNVGNEWRFGALAANQKYEIRVVCGALPFKVTGNGGLLTIANLKKNITRTLDVPTARVRGRVIGIDRPRTAGVSLVVKEGPRKPAIKLNNDGLYDAIVLPKGAAYTIAAEWREAVFTPPAVIANLADDVMDHNFTLVTHEVKFELRGATSNEQVRACKAKLGDLEMVALDASGGAGAKLGKATFAKAPSGRKYVASIDQPGDGFLAIPALDEFKLTADKEIVFTATLKRFTIGGTLKWDDGTNARDIDVTLWKGDDEVATKKTGANGKYEFLSILGGEKYVVQPVTAETTFDRWSQEIALLARNETVDFTRGVTVEYGAKPYIDLGGGCKAQLTAHAMENVRGERQRGNQAGHSVLLCLVKDAVNAVWAKAPYERAPNPSWRVEATDGSGTLVLVEIENAATGTTRLVHTCYYGR